MSRDIVPVRIAVGTDATGPLTWGQRAIWKVIEWVAEDAAYFNIPLLMDVPATATLDDVLTAIRLLLERHEGLHSTVDGDGPGLRQHVASTGELVVEVLEAPANRARALAGAVVSQLAVEAFDSTKEWPIRVCVLTTDGVPVHLCVVLSHLMVDGWSVGTIRTELATLLAGGSIDAPVRQPLEQAAREAVTPQRKVEAALEHWRSTLSRMPRSMFDFEQGPADDAGRFVRLSMDSLAVASAATQIAARDGVSTSTVVLAAAAGVIAAWTDHDEAGAQLIAGHRLDALSRAMVAPATCDAVFLVDARTGSFAQLVARTGRAALVSYRFGHYDPFAVDEIRAQVALARGGAVDVQALDFNDVRQVDGWRLAPDDLTPDAAAAAVSQTTVSFGGAWPRHNLKIFLTVDDSPHTARLVLTTDTAFVPRPMIEALLLGIEATLVAALDADLQLAEIGFTHVAPRGDGWQRIGPDWVDLAATEQLVREVSGSADVRLEVSGGRLVARLPAAFIGRDLGRRLVAAVGERTDVRAPDDCQPSVTRP